MNPNRMAVMKVNMKVRLKKIVSLAKFFIASKEKGNMGNTLLQGTAMNYFSTSYPQYAIEKEGKGLQWDLIRITVFYSTKKAFI